MGVSNATTASSRNSGDTASSAPATLSNRRCIICAGIERRRVVEGEGVAHHGLQAADQRRPEDQEPAAAGEQNGQGGEFRGARDLTLFARLVQAPL